MNSYDYQKLRGLKRKIELINLRGGKCEKCGYDKNLAAFEFHHRITDEKTFNLDMRHLSNQSMGVIMEEFKKCDLLCANCHREFHSPELDINNVLFLIKNVNESILSITKSKKPKCCDCGCEINYTYKRCTPCNNKYKTSPNKPSIDILKLEHREHGVNWCSFKYGVSRKTINRWLK
jgi:hypothetical protein